MRVHLHAPASDTTKPTDALREAPVHACHERTSAAKPAAQRTKREPVALLWRLLRRQLHVAASPFHTLLVPCSASFERQCDIVKEPRQKSAAGQGKPRA